MHPDEWANMCERIGVHPADISAAQSDESVLDDRLRRALAKSKTKLSEQHMQLSSSESDEDNYRGQEHRRRKAARKGAGEAVADSSVADSSMADSNVADSSVADSSVADSSRRAAKNS